MKTKRIIIDATHEEQTRVAMLNGNQLEDFEVEITEKKPLKGNIYLAKISRIEPSLQAVFVDFGSDKHGFLPFSEIHPDYFLISDSERAEIDEFYSKKREKRDDFLENAPINSGNKFKEDEEIVDDENIEDIIKEEEKDEEVIAEENYLVPPHKRFDIKDVLKRRQIILVQVTKEERGSKGAALSTYLSLAGRYCVLMPNTNHTGGVSRRISSVSDRRRLRAIINSLDTIEGMAAIVRTAGAQRSKLEIHRDYEYLLRVWKNIKDKAFENFSPSLLYEEADLIKRTIRDLFTKDISEVLISGERGYKSAKELTDLLIPSRTNKIIKYTDEKIPLFQRWNTEADIKDLLNPIAALPSGGYLVINPTEALIAVDVNSGKATSEKNIEETALATNLEAAQEVARQLRMRNLAGLVVIDFIDMEQARHRSMVERKIKSALEKDRSRVQIGKISPFGLLELSRQRTSPSLVESMTVDCPHCNGIGLRYSVESTALNILNGIEYELMKSKADMIIHASEPSVLWILNEKRNFLYSMEKKYNVRISLVSDSSITQGEYSVTRLKSANTNKQEKPPVNSTSTLEEMAENENKKTAKDNKPAGNKTKNRRAKNKKAIEETTKEEVATNDSNVKANADNNNGTPSNASNNDSAKDTKTSANQKDLKRENTKEENSKSENSKDAQEVKKEDTTEENPRKSRLSPFRRRRGPFNKGRKNNRQNVKDSNGDIKENQSNKANDNTNVANNKTENTENKHNNKGKKENQPNKANDNTNVASNKAENNENKHNNNKGKKESQPNKANDNTNVASSNKAENTENKHNNKGKTDSVKSATDKNNSDKNNNDVESAPKGKKVSNKKDTNVKSNNKKQTQETKKSASAAKTNEDKAASKTKKSTTNKKTANKKTNLAKGNENTDANKVNADKTKTEVKQGWWNV